VFVKEKKDNDGVFEKLKGRLVADGRGQDWTLYNNFQSPTANMETPFLELQNVAIRKKKWAKIDICGVYLNANLNDDDVIIILLGKYVLIILCEKFLKMKQYLDKNGNILV